ncbi:MAG: hypothetical protein AABY15_06810 [Nanoarchaeota archaeon]
MRKMFGFLSLIAICTVAFTSQANAKESPPDYSVVCDIGYETADVIAPLEVVKLEVIYVTDETVNCTGEGGLIAESVSNVTGDFIILYTLSFSTPDNTDNYCRWVGTDWKTNLSCHEPDTDIGKPFVIRC